MAVSDERQTKTIELRSIESSKKENAEPARQRCAGARVPSASNQRKARATPPCSRKSVRRSRGSTVVLTTVMSRLQAYFLHTCTQSAVVSRRLRVVFRG